MIKPQPYLCLSVVALCDFVKLQLIICSIGLSQGVSYKGQLTFISDFLGKKSEIILKIVSSSQINHKLRENGD